MKCPICEGDAWKVEYRPDVNIISLHCISCGSSTIDLDATAITEDYKINSKTPDYDPPY